MSDEEKPRPHQPGGMLNNGPVVNVVHWDVGSALTTRGVIEDFASVPAAYMIVRREINSSRRLIFCSAISYIEEE